MADEQIQEQLTALDGTLRQIEAVVDLPALEAVGLGQRGLSLGSATYEKGDDELRLLTRADEEMYEDKRSGGAHSMEDAVVSYANAA